MKRQNRELRENNIVEEWVQSTKIRRKARMGENIIEILIGKDINIPGLKNPTKT